MSTPQAPTVADVIATQAAAHLGDRITPAEAAELGRTALTALCTAGWTLAGGPGTVLTRLTPVLWPYDPAILAGLARGHTTAEIAQATDTPYATVRNRIDRLRSRIGARNSAHAVGIAYRAGWMGGLPPEPRGPLTLSTRQRTVLAHMSDGLNNAEIATQLGIGRETVVTYIRRLYNYLDVTNPGPSGASASSRPQAVALGYQHGLLPLHSNGHQPTAAAS